MRTLIYGALAFIAFIWLVYHYTYPYVDHVNALETEAERDRVWILVNYYYTLTTFAAFLVVVVGGIVAILQLKRIKSDRDAELTLTLLKYLGDPKVIRTRGLVYKYMPTVYQQLHPIMVTGEVPDRSQLAEVIDTCSFQKLSIREVEYWAIIMEHISIIIKEHLSKDLRRHFYYAIIKPWRSLDNFVYYEQKSRGTDLWVKYFSDLAETMESNSFRQILRNKWNMTPLYIKRTPLWGCEDICARIGKKRALSVMLCFEDETGTPVYKIQWRAKYRLWLTRPLYVSAITGRQMDRTVVGKLIECYECADCELL